MNCTNCKNPIQVSSGTCEWCGAQLRSNVGNSFTSNNSSSPMNSVNAKKIPRGRKVGIIIIAIIVFMLIYFQINPIT